MKKPSKTGKYPVVLMNVKTKELIETEKWYFADTKDWHYNKSMYTLSDFTDEPITGSTKEEWTKPKDMNDICVENLRNAVVKRLILDATCNTVEKKSLVQTKHEYKSGKVTKDRVLRHRKDSARGFIYSGKANWLTYGTDVNSLRMQYRNMLIEEENKKNKMFSDLIGNDNILRYLKKHGLTTYTNIRNEYVSKKCTLDYKTEIRKAIKAVDKTFKSELEEETV